jgi:hypothetical protein
MSQWWNLKETTVPKPLSVHEENVIAYLRAYFPEMPILERGIFYRLRKFLAFISQQLEASSIQSFNDLKEIVIQQSFPNEGWWVEKMKEFQHGDNLVVSRGRIGYASVNPSMRILKNVSVRTDSSQVSNIDLIIKYAKDRFALASEEEKAAILKYVNLIKIAGVKIQVREAVADLIKLTIRIDNFIGDTSTPDSPLNQGAGIPFGRILGDHFKQLPFDGIFSLSDAELALQNAFGNRYIRIIAAEYKTTNSGAYVSFPSTIASVGGYFSVDLANSLITFR